MKALFFALLLIGSIFANVCSSPSTTVCGANNQNYANESDAAANGTLVVYCGDCASYHSYQAQFYTWNASNSNVSQYNVTNRSYMERFLSSSMGRLVGNDPETGQQLLAILVGGFFFVFVSFQNTRIEAKAAVLIPAFILAAVFMGWILSILALVVGVILYIGLSRLLNK